MTKTGTPGSDDKPVRDIGFLLVPDFSPVCFFSAVEVLRTANRFLEKPYFGWKLFSQDGEAVLTSAGVAIAVDGPVSTDSELDILFVCAGFHPEHYCGNKILAWIRDLDRHGTSLGAISTGTYILARAGIIGERRCTIHSENFASLQEDFFDLTITSGIFEIDRNLYTCAGGTSAIDLFVHLVSADHGEEIAASIAHQFQHDRIRNSTDHQSRSMRLGLRVKSEKVAQAIDIMEQNIEQPLTSEEIAALSGITPRQLQRLFKNYTGRSPLDFYLNLRLNHGRLLLLQTSLPIIDVAVASGFVAHSHFTKCYRDEFGYPPRLERKKAL